MKTLVLAGIALVGLAGAPALAADYVPPSVADYVPPSVYDWTGFYLGIHGGGAWSDVDWDFESAPFDGDQDDEGWFAGGQLGANWQIGTLVLGLEADIAKAWIDDDASCGDGECNHEVDWFGSGRGRIGWALDRVLLYGTGGVGFGEFEFDETFLGVGSVSETQVGWVAGGGVEWAFTDHWSAKFEYLYYDLGKEAIEDGDPAAATIEISMHTIKFGVNFKF
jgi:outer membrane immunogenic protein